MPKDPVTPLTLMVRTRLCDRVAVELRRLVVHGVYPPGSRLPSATELAQQLGVTRLTVREALAQLQANGLTQTRHGCGTYVTESLAHATLQTLSETLAAGRDLSHEELASLLQFREIVITGFSALIAGSEGHADGLEAIVRSEWAALGRPEDLAQLDYRLNEALALASGNLFYTMLIRSVARAHIYLGNLVFRHCGDGSIVIKTHEAIVKAVRKRDAQALHRRLKTYLQGGNLIVTAWLRDQATSETKE